jgi:hypothetical protein
MMYESPVCAVIGNKLGDNTAPLIKIVPGHTPPMVVPDGSCIIPPTPPDPALEPIGTPPTYMVFPET